MTRLIEKTPKGNVPYSVYNVGNSRPIKLIKVIRIIEKILNKKAKLNFVEKQTGDVYKTHASIAKISKITHYKPKTNINKGIDVFIKWFREYHKI